MIDNGTIASRFRICGFDPAADGLDGQREREREKQGRRQGANEEEEDVRGGVGSEEGRLSI